MSKLALSLLGTPYVKLNDAIITIERRKVMALLVFLAITRRTYRRDYLASLFWPSYDQSSARANLRRALSVLNRTLDQNWLQTDREHVTLNRNDGFWLDVERFQQLLNQCTAVHPANEPCSTCLESLTQAVALYQGDFLSGFSLSDSPLFDEWQLVQTENLRRELASALENLAQGFSAQHDFEQALAFARRRLALESASRIGPPTINATANPQRTA